MNPLNNGASNGLPPELKQSIQKMKRIMNMANGNPMVALQQMAGASPQINNVLQMLKQQNQEQIFIDMCKNGGIDPQAVINELCS